MTCRKYTSKPLRDVMMPFGVKNYCKFFVECHPSVAPIEQLAECAKSVSVSHEATVLRPIPARLSAFLTQEFDKKAN